MNRRQLSMAIGVMVGLIEFTPLSVRAMVPAEAHSIHVCQKVAPTPVLLSSAYVPEHPLAGGRADPLRPFVQWIDLRGE